MDTVSIRAVYDIDPVDVWHTDSVALVGDAAHSMLHHQGQGANSAILDAGGLADALKEADSVKEALALYQANRKPVTDELSAQSRVRAGPKTKSTTCSPARRRQLSRLRPSKEATTCPCIPRSLSSSPPCRPRPRDRSTLRSCAPGDETHVAPLEQRLPLHAVEDTAAGDVPVRIYTPVDADAYGLLVYFHGGAFFLGSLNTHDHVARNLAKETGLEVISVDYRLAPEAAFPAGLEDCHAVVRWAAENGEALKWDGKTLALAGDSFGWHFCCRRRCTGTRRGIRPHHAPGTSLPLAGPGLRRRSLRISAGERRRVRRGDGRTEGLQQFLFPERC